MQVVGAILLVLLGVSRFMSGLITSPSEFILSIYYFIFGVILVLAELQLPFIMRYITFLYYSWGKALLDFFIGSLCFSFSGNVYF